MKKTFSELKEINECVVSLFSKNKTLENSKFGYWYNKFYKKNIKPIVTEMEEKLADCRLENALTDPITKEILYLDPQNNNFKFDKEGLKNLMIFHRKLIKEYDEKEFNVIPFISKEIPKELKDDEKELLTGVLL